MHISLSYIVNQSSALDVQVLPVKSVLEQSDDIVSDGVLGRETFCPCQEKTFVECRLLDRETVGKMAS